MGVRRRFLYFGVFLITAGAVLLVGQGSDADRAVIAEALRLWPLVVVALGIGLLVRGTRLSLPAGVVAAAMPGLLFGGVVVVDHDVSVACGDSRSGVATSRDGVFVGSSTIDLELACGDLSVTTAPGSRWLLETDETGYPVVVDTAANRLSVTSGRGTRAFWMPHGGETWRLVLPVGEQLDLRAEVHAGRADLDLAGARLDDLRLTVNAGEAQVDLREATVERLAAAVNAGSMSIELPDARDLSGELTVNAGALEVCAGPELGLRVHDSAALGRTVYNGLVREGVIRSDGLWESPGFASARYHADLTISASVGSIEINPIGGCK